MTSDVTTKTAVLAAGGTGGHLFPAEALAKVLAARGWRIVLATDERGDQYAHNFPATERLALDVATFKPGNPLAALAGLAKIAAGVMQARAAYARLKPHVVVGFGGYPSLPGLLAGLTTGVPTVLHEQNAVLGRSNRALAGRVNAVASAFPTLMRASPAVRKRVKVVGNPVRPEIQALSDKPYAAPTDAIRLFVTGGSQGARLLSEMVPAAVALLPDALRHRLKVVQQTRPESLDAARRIYADAVVEAQVAPFFRDVAGQLAQAHLVIGRAGASTVCEVAVAGLPSLLVPLKIAMDDHQTYNARLLTDVGAAEAIDEDSLDVDALAGLLQSLLSNPQELIRRALAARSVAIPDAAERLADLVEATARKA